MPTALYIYSRGLTRLLVLDLDAKTYGSAAVEQDARWLRTLIERAGGRVVEDFNPASGGRHLYVPLAEAATRRHLLPVLHALRAVCRTLDIGPMSNAGTGCIVPPGSPTKDGATRQLVDELTAARDALTERSDRGLLPRLAAELATNTAESPDEDLAAPDLGDALEGLGDQARLQSALRLHSPVPGHVADFATRGAMTTWWGSRSEARQSVLTHLALRGWSLIDVHDAMHQRGIWPGLASSYAKYRTASDRQLARDWAKAQTTAAALGANFLTPGHKKELTAPASSSGPFAVWLDRADRWCEREYGNRPRRRAVVAAVLQALAVMAAAKEDLVNGTPTVAVGGRSLSLVAGLMPETTVWDVLAEIRDIPGSPILRIGRGVGTAADRYALVRGSAASGPGGESVPGPRRACVEVVHPAWSVVGLTRRRLYELVTVAGLTRPADLYAAAHISPSAGAAIVTDLVIYGLLTRSYGIVEPGTVTLDDVAQSHGLGRVQAAIISRHRHERAVWREWLHRFDTSAPEPGPAEPAITPTPPAGWHEHDDAIWKSMLADMPPPDEPRSVDELAVLLLMEELGATLLVPAVDAGERQHQRIRDVQRTEDFVT